MVAGQEHPTAHWTRVRLTRAGWVFLVISVLVGFAAGKSEAALTLILFGVMIVALCISVVLAWRMVNAVRVRRDMPHRAWQNQTVHLAYHLRNTRKRGASLGLNVEEIAPGRLDSAAGYCVHLPPAGVFRAGARFAPRRRGRIRLQRIRVSSSFPFGLIRAHRHVDAPASLAIWPGRGRIKHQMLYRGAVEISSLAPGGVTGGQDEFFGLRDYLPGDNPRWIHWRRSATKDTPVIREMARPVPETLWVVLDTYVSSYTDIDLKGRERLLRFTATLIDHAFSRGFRVGLSLAYNDGARTMTPAEGRGQRCTLLDALCDVDINTRVKLSETLAGLRRAQLREGQVVLIAPDADRFNEAPVNLVRSACRHLAVVTERELPEVFEDNPLAEQEHARAT